MFLVVTRGKFEYNVFCILDSFVNKPFRDWDRNLIYRIYEIKKVCRHLKEKSFLSLNLM